MLSPRCKFAAATLPDGYRVAVAGGYADRTLANAEVFDVRMDTWLPLPQLSVPRDNVCGCVVQVGELRGCFVVIGGRHNTPHAELPAGVSREMMYKTCEYQKHDESGWEELPPLNVGRYGASCVAVGPHILVVGGFNGSIASQTSELYDPVRRRWLLLPNQPYSSSFRALVLGN